MGYFHFWNNTDISDTTVENACKIIDASTVQVFGPSGKGDPEVSKDHICINGDASKGKDAEAFYLANPDDPTNEWRVKTLGLHYDEVVGAIMIDITVRGEGDFRSEIWIDKDDPDYLRALALYERAVAPLSDGDRQRIEKLFFVMDE